MRRLGRDLRRSQRFYAWDVFNRMTSASGPGGTATYTYNGDGLKIRRIGPDGTTRYYYDRIRPIWESDGAGSMTAQLDRDIFGNLLSRKEPAGTRRYYHFDGLGSTTALSDEGGAAVATLLYDAWGKQRAATGGPVPNYRFTGAELDTASGLYHMGARFYDPTVGRWLSEDSIQDRYFEPDSLNFYNYSVGNPVRYIDSRGESVQDQVKEWLKVGWAYALKKLKELYDLMSKVKAGAKEALGEQYRVFEAQGLVFVLALQFMGMQLGSPGMPDPSSALGTLVADWQANPESWKIAVMNTTPATGSQYRGGTSVKIIFQRISDGAVFGYHVISMGARVAHAHFAESTLPLLLRWLFQ